jgi:hypothetical protein
MVEKVPIIKNKIKVKKLKSPLLKDKEDKKFEEQKEEIEPIQQTDEPDKPDEPDEHKFFILYSMRQVEALFNDLYHDFAETSFKTEKTGGLFSRLTTKNKTSEHSEESNDSKHSK